MPLVLADMMRGTGRYSLAQGVFGTIQGIGGSTCQRAGGFIVALFGYSAGFLALSVFALAALLSIVSAMPETRPEPGKPQEPTSGGIQAERRYVLSSRRQSAGPRTFYASDSVGSVAANCG
jgi:hypothetical protein